MPRSGAKVAGVEVVSDTDLGKGMRIECGCDRRREWAGGGARAGPVLEERLAAR
jgi:hypothetical protein